MSSLQVATLAAVRSPCRKLSRVERREIRSAKRALIRARRALIRFVLSEASGDFKMDFSEAFAARYFLYVDYKAALKRVSEVQEWTQ
jgi:hypothetical protein